MAIISVAELYEGVFRSADPAGNEDRLKDFLSEVTVVGVDEDICKVFGAEMARLRRAGTPIGNMDLLIAATALYHGLTLLTSDTDFRRVESLNVEFR